MAISWTTKITDVNTSTFKADVSFARTDDTGAQPEFHMSFNDVVLETPAQRLALLDQVWAEWQVENANRGAKSEFIGNLEQTANSNLMAREA
jgi:hypothetical protein